MPAPSNNASHGGGRPPGMWQPDAFIALLRIGVGAFFAKALFTKLAIVHVAGVPLPGVSARWLAVMPRLVAKQANGNPIAWYTAFLTDTVYPHHDLFAHLTAWGEAVTGVLLVLGFLTGIGSIIGMVLIVNYGLATQWMAPSERVMHVLLFALLLTFFLARAGRRWGLDAVVARRTRGWISRRPCS